MRLDVGAVAKGYAVEQTARWLEREGVTSLLLSVGGNASGYRRQAGRQKGGYSRVISIKNPDKSADDRFPCL